MTTPFAGLRVIDFSTTVAGPICTRMLADLGAEVIKIEPPEGEMMRIRPPLRDGASTTFGQLNVGKQSVALDLKTPFGHEAARRIIDTADILVENFRPGVMKRLGLGYDVLGASMPRLIYCSISGYGQTGPSSKQPAYASVVHAASGFDLGNLVYQEGRSRPDYCGIYVADVLSGVHAFGAIGAALHQRASTGLGQLIDVSMFEAMLGLMMNEIQNAQFPFAQPSRPFFGPVETKDGYVNVAIAAERTFQGLAQAAGRPGLVTDPRFEKYNDRRTNWAEFMDIVESWSRTVSSVECMQQFDLYGVPAAAYRTVKEALADAQLSHRQALTDVADDGGTFTILNQPFVMSGSQTRPGNRAPTLGEHTRQVLSEVGLSAVALQATTV
jgi:crotonobetainyl-CoA:carnitine CoA-transferase CaiB-like acyl-CoA transferase